MAATDWYCFGGTEIINSARTHAYASRGLKPVHLQVQDCGCPGLAGMLEDEPYTLPSDDGAPWYDPGLPESADFAGVLLLDVKGLDSAPIERPVRQRAGDGAVFGRPRYLPREIVFTGIAIGRTSCAIDYGIKWLSSALQGSLACGDDCGGGDDLDYLSCCPTVAGTPGTPCGPGSGAGGSCPGPCDHPDCAELAWRTLRNVALTRSPEVVEQFGGACQCCPGVAKVVQWTLTAARPHALRAPVEVARRVTWPASSGEEEECVTWTTGDTCLDDEGQCAAAQLQPCVLDPRCPPPTLPELPVPPNPCLCEPWSRREVCVPIPPQAAPIWSDTVPVMEIYSGALPLRGVRVRFVPNPLGLPADQLDQCGACAELNVSYLPRVRRSCSTGRAAWRRCAAPAAPKPRPARSCPARAACRTRGRCWSAAPPTWRASAPTANP
ncbi:hypothetical protein [Nonomuraea salmonea]|uniref:hypothetical protein n=1 Tax=Nonomuraea salmonea TaxID=46181 RepID=UPI002FEB1DC1